MHDVIFWALSSKHKKWYIINNLVVVFALIASMIIAWSVNEVQMPTEVSKLSASTGFVTGVAVLLMALLNKAGSLFKVRSMGFLIFFIIFMTIRSVLDVLMWTTGLMTAVLLIQDIIFEPIWKNVWWNDYPDQAKAQRIQNLQPK